jgi:APA family basic amino acid/polyamine antiporter
MEDQTGLKRVLGPVEVILSGIGVILGAGIYALIGEAAATAGNALWLAFLFSAAIAAFTGLSYAELSSMYPFASAEYEYTSRSFGKIVAFIIGIMVILSGIVGASTVALGFAGYLQGITGFHYMISAMVLIIGLSLIIFYGIRQSAAVVIIFTLIEAGGLIGIIAIGLPYLGSVDYFEMPLGIAGVFQASALIFFAYQGFEEMVKLSEETINPERNIPRGLIIALSVTIVLYMLTAFAAVSVIGWAGLAGSPAPFALIAGDVFGQGAFILFTFIALFATANTALLMLLSSSRIMYGMARSGSLSPRLGHIHSLRRTPALAITTCGVCSLLFLLLGNIRDIALVANFTLFTTFIVINATVIVLRKKEPGLFRPFKVPGSIFAIPVIPVLGVLTCIFFLFQMDARVLLLGIALVLVAAIGGVYIEGRKG